MRLLFLLAALALSPAACFAQQSGGEFSISGVVINSHTGEPVRQALVTGFGMAGPDPAAQPGPADRMIRIEPVLTDASGRFHVRGLRGARYLLSAEKPGFAREEKEQNWVTLGPSFEGLAIRLSPLGGILGRVLDGDGEPVPSVQVRALYSRIENGHRIVSESQSAGTDDLGRYHLWRMPPGTYYIQAAGRSGETQFYVGPTPTVVSAHEGFEPLYYPAAADWKSATPITLAAGASFEADLQVLLQPAFRVAGTVRNHDPQQAVEITASRLGKGASAARATVAPGSGRFAVYDLVPGTYVIQAVQRQGNETKYARQEVQIGGADVEGVALEMAAGADVKVAVTGKPPHQEAEVQQPEPDTDGRLPPQGDWGEGAGASVQLIDADNAESNETYSGEPAPGGTLVASGVPEGRYRVLIEPAGGYVASAVAGGQDLLHGGLLAVVPGVTPPVIEIVRRFDGGTINGSIAKEADGPERWVLIVPAAQGVEPIAIWPQHGKFELSDLAPGDYRVYLLKGRDTVEYANPDVVSALRGGEDVHLSAGDKAEVVLKELAQ